MPMELTAGIYVLDAFDNTNQRIATTTVILLADAPQYLGTLPPSPLAQKIDGSIVNATNPVQPGDLLRLRITGQGALQPAVPSGKAAQPATTYKTAEAVIVTV